MAVSLTPYFKALAACEDVSREMAKWCGSLAKEKVLGDRVMVAVYGRPEKTAGGIYVSDTQIQEDQYQSCVGKIIAMGNLAFLYDGQFKWEGPKPKVGDFVLFRPADGFQCAFRKSCIRLFRSDSIQMIVSDPLLYY